MLAAIISLSVLAVLIGTLLAYAAGRLEATGEPVVNEIDQLLPQTQCGQCGHAGCRPYAAAIAAGRAEINQCPPGGQQTIRMLAELLGREATPLNSDFGVEKEAAVARIDEDICIGCTLCIHACPVDAIIGASRRMHTVIAEECTGCELCLPPCPVDCIEMLSPTAAPGTGTARRRTRPPRPVDHVVPAR